MAKDFDLTSQKWLDLVFKDKNKAYGAYELRETSSDRHLKALIIVTLVGLALIYLPALVKQAIPEREKEILEVSEIEMSDLTVQQEIPEENIIRELEAVPPPPALKETVQFTPPKIVEDDQVGDKEMIAQDELTDTKAQISVASVVGTTDGVDIADIIDHKVVVQAEVKPDEIFSHVEEPPQFPGGQTELMKWLQSQIQYPAIASEQGIQGRVTLRFVVEPDGSVGHVEVLKSLDPSCDREAMRVVSKMPKWQPGRQNGNPVRVYFTLPVQFRLDTR